MVARSFKDLTVWQNGMDLAMQIFELTKTFPSEEKFSLTDQIRRSSRSVPANISEAWRKRRYVPAFCSKLNDAETEGAETQTSIEMARRCGYWGEIVAAELDARYEVLLNQLSTMIDGAESWCKGVKRSQTR
jgi:four helix bundle protein